MRKDTLKKNQHHHPYSGNKWTMNRDEIKSILVGFINKSSHIESAAVMTRDGIPLVSCLTGGVDPGTLSAVSASLLSLANKTLSQMTKGKLQQVLIQGDEGFVLLVGVGDNAVLSITSEPDSKLGILLHEAKLSARKIASLL